MKFTKLEKITLGVTAVTLAFLAGWFLSRQDQSGQVFRPSPVTPPPHQAASPTPEVETETEAPAVALRVNLNTATAEELTALPGIGAKKAADIVAYREANGPFPVVESLGDVPGIGPSILEQCGPFITVED